jgi:hypothetical protein
MENQKWTLVENSKKHKNIPKTYILSVSAGLDYQQIRNILKDWKEIKIHQVMKKQYIDLIYVDGGIKDKRLYNINCRVKSLLNETKFIITNKWNLYVNMKKYFPEETKKYMVLTRTLDEITEIKDDEILLIKPVGRNAYAGKDIICVTKFDEIKEAEITLKKYPQTIAVNYIKNPLLIDGKKFHIRSYMLVTQEPFNVLLFNKSKIITAKEKYINGDYYNKNIHDTHISSTTKNRYFPMDIDINEENKEYILKQIKHIVNLLTEIIKNNVEAYPESKYAFEVFGMDFIVTEDFNVYLIEVNEKIGMKNADETDKTYSDFSYEYFKWIYDNAVKPFFQ